MATVDQNERWTRVGPGTPMGELMRRYWHPIAATSELTGGYGGQREAERSGTPSMTNEPVKEVRLLGEDLVLYRSRSGRLGLIANRCAHRGMDLSYGIPEDEGLRCAYHGWLYDYSGQCIDQPAEPERSNYKNEIRLPAYAVEELGGMIWAYLGPEPVPLLPRWDLLVWENVTRDLSAVMLPCNWLQTVDNALDPAHFEHLHGYYGSWVAARKGSASDWDDVRLRARAGHHIKLGFDRFEHGIIKRRLTEGTTEEHINWQTGHPIVFPYTLRVGTGNRHTFLLRVPVDDDHTWYARYTVIVPEPGETAPKQDVIPLGEIPLHDDRGRLVNHTIQGQDQLAWVGQGAVNDRTVEHLGVSDTGIVVFRRLIEEQLQIVEDGGDPINVFRDPSKNQCVVLPVEGGRYPGYAEPGGPFAGGHAEKAEVEVSLL